MQSKTVIQTTSKAKGTSDESEFLKNLPPDVTSLTPDDLESFLKSSEEAFVMFYAPCLFLLMLKNINKVINVKIVLRSYLLVIKVYLNQQ